MSISISYALFTLANHRVLSTTTLLSTPSLWLSLHCTDKTLRELQYISTEIQNNEQQGSTYRVQTTEFTVILCLHGMLLHCVLFLFASTAAATAATSAAAVDNKNQVE